MTHRHIKSKFLRRIYASELWQARQMRPAGQEYFSALRVGIESGIWAVQKAMIEDMNDYITR